MNDVTTVQVTFHLLDYCYRLVKLKSALHEPERIACSVAALLREVTLARQSS